MSRTLNRATLPSHVWHLKGTKPGPRVVLMGGTHGDELTGAELVRFVLKAYGLLNTKPCSLECPDITGELFLVFGNPEAMLRRSRSATGGSRDMNRCFTPGQINQEKSHKDALDIKRARQLAPLLASADYLFDIHATSTKALPFVCFGNDSLDHRTLYSQIPVEFVLTDPNIYLSRPAGIDGLGTTDSWTNTHGGVALCYETGWENAVRDVPKHLLTILQLLELCGLATTSFTKKVKKVNDVRVRRNKNKGVQRIYKLTHCKLVDKTKKSFVYAPGIEQGIWTNFSEGALIGRYDDGTEVCTPHAGMLLFPTASHKLLFGAKVANQSLYYIAEQID